MKPAIRVAILGAGGYGAAELLRLFTQHEAVDVVSVTSTSHIDRSVGQVHPHLDGFYDLRITEHVDVDRLTAADDAVIFSALPHGVSAAAIDALLVDFEHRGLCDRVRVIDLSGDLRLTNKEMHERHYPQTPLLSKRREAFVYGLPELNRDAIRSARFVANPGCLASAAILATAPLACGAEGLSLAIDAKTGSSGSGVSLRETTHHATRHADFRAYKPLRHQHEPEILQALGDPHGDRTSISFVPHSMDAARGVFVTVHATLPEAREPESLRKSYAEYYADCPFVRIVADSPRLQNVVGSNFCEIAVALRQRQVIVMAAIDNLVKGMAGTAIQNMNLMCGLPETMGLWTPSLRPV